MSLQDQLKTYKEGFLAKAPQEKIQAFDEGVEAVVQSGVVDKAVQVGQLAPDFSLTNAVGETITLSEVLKNGPVVLTWYRGGWCPYCNLTLRSLQEALPAIHRKGATLLALTPELPDKSLSTAEKHALTFEVLSDVNNIVARQYGIMFQLTPEVKEYYDQGFGMLTYNGHDRPELPLAATYIIGQESKVSYAFLDADYRKRAEPADILQALGS
ncbi:MAG: peroxiredoxin-like family protein [Bacteroidota bacterium]